MQRRRAALIDRIGYWTILLGMSAFWLIGAYVTALFLSMSAGGRLDGGLLVNIGSTVFAGVWITGLTAFVLAIWNWRRTRGDVPLTRLARMPRPTDPAEATVWRCMKIAWYAWISLMALMAVALLLALLGIW